MREASSLEMIPFLSKNGAKIKYYDPTGFKKEFNKLKYVRYSNAITDAGRRLRFSNFAYRME